MSPKTTVKTKYGYYECDILTGKIVKADSIYKPKNSNILRHNRSIYSKLMGNKVGKYSVVIILGYNCNLNCRYCFQKNNDDNPIDLRCQYKKELLHHLMSKINTASSASLAFSGGEPTIYLDEIEYIVQKLHKLITKKSKDFKFGLITNGVFINDEIERILDLYQYGCRWLQISIHQEGLSYYRKHLNEVLKRLNKYKITLRFNIGSSLNDNFIGILKRISNDEHISNKSISLVARRLQDQECLSAQAVCRIYNNINKIYSFALDMNFHVPLTSVFEQCNIGHPTTEVILPDMTSVPCIMFASSGREHTSRMLTAYSRDKCSISQFDDFQVRCRNCTYFIFCLGGCRVANYNSKGVMGIGECHISHMEVIMKNILKRKINKKLDGLHD